MPESKTLIRICQPRFRSFSEAVELVLRPLSEVVPGTLLLGRLDPDERVCRVIGVDGAELEGVFRGALLPLGNNGNGHGGEAAGSGGTDTEIARDFLDAVGVESSLAIPLEMSDGRIVATLAALHSEPAAYSSDHAVLIGVAARLLSYEWERVELRAELRRVRGRLPQTENVDQETGLLNRDGFLDLLDHDWRLAERGTVESMVIAFRLDADPARGPGGAMSKVALRIAAEVLEGNVRATDRAGRVGETTLAATLVGCGPEQAPAFIERFHAALERVTRNGEPSVSLSHGLQSLAGADSAPEALSLAEAAAAAPRHSEAGRQLYEGVPG